MIQGYAHFPSFLLKMAFCPKNCDMGPNRIFAHLRAYIGGLVHLELRTIIVSGVKPLVLLICVF